MLEGEGGRGWSIFGIIFLFCGDNGSARQHDQDGDHERLFWAK